jgi:hypothetical protein
MLSIVQKIALVKGYFPIAWMFAASTWDRPLGA